MLGLYKLFGRIRDKVAALLFRGSFHAFGSRSVLCLPFRSGGESAISLGSGVYVGRDSWIEVMGAPAPGSEPVIEIGDGVSISGFCTITAVSKVVIGPGVLIARFVHISDHSHATGDPGRPIKDQGVAKTAPVRIGEGAWLGHGVVVCPGVTIGRNAVIGANSVVLSDIPDFAVAVGSPARVVRRAGEKASQPA